MGQNYFDDGIDKNYILDVYIDDLDEHTTNTIRSRFGKT
jgi:hypothetical protein